MKRCTTSKSGLTFLAALLMTFISGLASAGGPIGPSDHCGDQFNGFLIHLDKIVFRPREGLKFRCDGFATDPPTKGTVVFTYQDILDIKVVDDPFSVADVRGKAAQFLNFSGCVMVFGEVPVHKSHIVILDVEYATACVGEPEPPPAQ